MEKDMDNKDNIPQFIKDQDKIVFEPIKHKYSINGKELMSVTQFIDLFTNPFDPTGEILIRCAQKEGMTPKALKKIWNQKGTKGANRGTKWHKSIEYYLLNNKIRKNKVTDLVKYFRDNFGEFGGDIYPEVRAFSQEVGICGTTDVCQIIDNKVLNIFDWKSNKKIDDWSFGKKMKYPLEHVNDSKLQRYTIQVQIYSYLLCSKYGYVPGNDNCIFWVDQKKRQITKIPINIDYSNVMNMFSFYLYNKSLEKQ